MKTQMAGTIRRSTDKDKSRIREIAVAAWRPIFARYRLIAGDDMWNDLWSNWEANWFKDASGVVTELDGQIVGFATWWWPIEGTLGEVGGNAVDPKFQGHGVGTAQMRWLIDSFREWGARCVKVHTGMDPAHGPARAEYRHVGLRRGVKNSRYYNYLSEVARVPIRSSLSFRWAAPDDADLVRQMTRSAWASVSESVRQTLGDQLFEVAFRNASEEKAERCAKVVSETPEKVRIVMEDGRPAGFAILDMNPAKKLGELRTVGVIPEFRGKGIGCALCMDAFEVFRERELRYAGLSADLGEVNEQTRQMCWNVGLYRELPSIDYYMML